MVWDVWGGCITWTAWCERHDIQRHGRVNQSGGLYLLKIQEAEACI